MLFNQNLTVGLLHDDKPLMQSLIGPRIMAILDKDLEEFETEATVYFFRGYLGFSIVRFDNPTFYLRDDRPGRK